jgi:hypothetical protein
VLPDKHQPADHANAEGQPDADHQTLEQSGSEQDNFLTLSHARTSLRTNDTTSRQTCST